MVASCGGSGIVIGAIFESGTVIASVSQPPHNAGNVIFLEEPDPGNASGPRFHTLPGIFKGNAAQRDHWDFLPANVAQCLQSCRSDVGRIPLLEYRSEDGKVRLRRSRARHLPFGVTGNRNDRPAFLAASSLPGDCRKGACVTRPDGPRNRRIDVHRGEVHTVSAAGDRDVSTGIDQDSSCRFTLRSGVFANGSYGRMSQHLQLMA